MNGRIDSGLGQIIIDTDVIATYAGSVADGLKEKARYVKYCIKK